MQLTELAAARVAVWGFGREGRASLSALRRRFPHKALTLICSAGEQQAALARDDANLTVHAGEISVEQLREFDIVIKSPGISPYKPPLAQAIAAGVRFTSASALWFGEHAQARTICVTGTKGKSTVSALIAHILRKSGKCVALAGNIGLPLLELPDVDFARVDWSVIELSSFQTCDFDAAPTVAVINNLYEEHLDWHVSREQYMSDKLAIAARAQRLVVNGAQPELLARTADHASRTLFGQALGWHVGTAGVLRGALLVLDHAALPLAGEHNALNVCAALAAIEAAGEDATSMAGHVSSFRALPHRLQSLGMRDGIEYVNDSIATTPYATIEALRSLAPRATTVLVGGFDRGVDWKVFVDYVAKYPPHAIVTMGANGALIAAALERIGDRHFQLVRAQTLEQAIGATRECSAVAGVILLSPGAPSFDAFHDYAERGREFARLAGVDPQAITQIEGLGIA